MDPLNGLAKSVAVLCRELVKEAGNHLKKYKKLYQCLDLPILYGSDAFSEQMKKVAFNS